MDLVVSDPPNGLARPLWQRVADRPLWLLWGYLFLITIAELVTSLVRPQLGMLMHALLLVGLTIRGGLGQRDTERRFTLALALAPLIRLLSLAMPLTAFPQLAWYPIVAAPLLLATGIIIRQLQLARADLGLRPGNLFLQLLLMGGGLGLGAVEYWILAPAPLIASYSWNALLLAALTLIVATGFSEELIFRGVLQAVALPALGRWALVYVSLLFASLHIGYLSAIDVVFVFGVGWLFAHIVRWSGSILGVSLAHGVTNVTLFLIMPYLAQQPAATIAAVAPWVIWGGTAIAVIALDVVMLRSLIRQAAQPGAPSGTGIRALRRTAGLTYTDLAQRTGIPARMLAEIEHGLRPLQPEHLRRIAQGLGVAPHTLTAAAH